MPFNNYAGKADPTKPYRIDSRVTLNIPLKPVSADRGAGPHVLVQSGTRVNYPSGTDN
jgi:hypothetical protein